MKILHITFGLPPYVSGGLPLYVERLIDYQIKSGCEVFVLEPGSLNLKKIKIKKVKNSKIQLYRIYKSLPVSYNFGISNPKYYLKKVNKTVYEKFLKAINPNIIHVHSIMGIHKEFFEVARQMNIRIVMTTHDYFGLCLRSNFINNNDQLCKGQNKEKCALCNYNRSITLNKQMLIQTDLYKNIKNNDFLKDIRKKQRIKLNKIKKGKNTKISKKLEDLYGELLNYYKDIYGYIDYFIYSSSLCKKIYCKNLPTKGEVLHITLPEIHKYKINKKSNKKMVIGYIGRREKYKGVDILVEAVKKLKNVECYLYGDDFEEYEDKKHSIYSKGVFLHENINEVLSNIDILVVPSICYETFCFPIIEGLSFNIPVLVSENVGAKDLIKKAPINAIFKPTSEDLCECIKNVQKDDNYLKYKNWIESSSLFDDMETHINKMNKIYEKVINSD